MKKRGRFKVSHEVLVSLLLGCPSLSIAVFDATTLMRWPMKGVTRRGTIVVSYRTAPVRRYVDGVPTTHYESTGVPAIVRPARWNVPEAGFFAFTTFGLVLAFSGLMLSKKRRSWLCIAALTVNLFVLLIGYSLLFFDGD